MQKLLKNPIFTYILGVLSTIGITSVFAYSIFANDVGYNPKDEDWEVDNTGSAIDDLHETCDYCKTRFDGLEWGFAYEGKEEQFTVPLNGIYILETWGAQGGSTPGNKVGGYGAYSIGVVSLTKGQKLFINVGGAGTNGTSTTGDYTGGYNGGGNSYHWLNNNTYNASGGGATHIAMKSGTLASLGYTQAVTNEMLLIASGGGGGAYYYASNENANGGSAGGIKGINGGKSSSTNGREGYGATQSAGGSFASGSRGAPSSGSFGKGGNSSTASNNGGGSGGGGGYYGGGGSTVAGAGGGSSYIASSNLKSLNTITKHMTCYNCTTSDEKSTKTISTTNVSSNPISDYAKSGNGYAKVTLLTVS
ncbi:MAG: hypothetical protein IJ572_00860 [Bacilli bacterium]|nr:hypothetical protein [Bacilli bacterium]